MYGEAYNETAILRQACISTVLLTGIWSDLKMQKVYNSMLLAGSAMGILLAAQAARPPDAAGLVVPEQLLEMLIRGFSTWGRHFAWTIAVLYVFFLTGGLGAGDVKLCAVMAGMMSFGQIRTMLLASLLLGAMAGILYLEDRIRKACRIRQKMKIYELQELLLTSEDIFKRPAAMKKRGSADSRGKVHFTIFIAGGYLITLLMGIE